MHTRATKQRSMRKNPFKRPWSIRAQLMLFLCSISLGLLCLVWVLSSQLLQPYYNDIIRTRLEEQLNSIVSLMDTMDAAGVMISTRNDETLIVNTAFQTAFNQAVNQEEINLSNLCVNIADTSLLYVMYSESVYPCLLHGGTSTLFGDDNETPETRNNEITVSLREQCFAEGEIYVILSSGEWQQMLVGKTTANGEYVVLVSASLSQVVDAALVLQSLAPSVGIIVLILALFAAWQFSRWFTTPISNLTKASHVMANGDYSVQVSTQRTDEFGELSDEFNKMAREVRRSAQLQTELLANVSHDLRTPLTLIRGYAETLRDITGAKPEKRNDQLNIIIDETDRLTLLVNSILELSKVSAGVEKYQPMPIELAPFCEAIAARYHGICLQNGWQLQLDLPSEPIVIVADAAMLERALDNLLGNAMHHIGADNTFVLRAYPTDVHSCRIEVEDHGEGISPEEQEALFERYYRSRTSKGRQGTGLGLSIARAIFQQHGFRFGVESTPYERTSFWFIAQIAPTDYIL